MSSILNIGNVFIVRESIEVVSDAGSFAHERVLSSAQIDNLAGYLGKSPAEVSRVVRQLEENTADPRLSDDERARLASLLDVPRSALDVAVDRVESEPQRERRRPEDALRMLGYLCLGVVGLYIVRYWFVRGQTYFLSLASLRLANELRRRLFVKLQRMPVSYFGQRRAGAIQSVLTNDVNVYQNAVGIIRDTIDAPVKAVGALASVFYFQWQLGLVAMIFLPIMALAIQRNARKMRVAQSKVQDDLASLSATTQEAIQGTRVVKAFSAEDRAEHDYSVQLDKSFRSQLTAIRRLASLRPLVELIGAAGLATVLYICGWLAFQGQLHVADIAAVVFALDIVNQGLRSIGSVNNTFAQVQAASDRIHSEVLGVPEEHVEERGHRTLERPSGEVEFRNVSFAYPDGTEALRRVSFTLSPGTSLALVGPSGAGKSTIADLLLRFYDPSEGQILFDGIDIRELDLKWLRSQIGVVPQQTFLFAGTIADNIRMGAPQASDVDIAEAVRAAHADVFLDQLPARYETEVGEQGSGLSGGERQRVAIARALIRKPTILLLDEATSALDASSEKAVTEALEEIMKQRTTLFIAHRLTTAARADRILVLRRGEVVEQGSHKELMEQNGAYAGLFRAFSNGVLDE